MFPHPISFVIESFCFNFFWPFLFIHRLHFINLVIICLCSSIGPLQRRKHSHLYTCGCSCKFPDIFVTWFNAFHTKLIQGMFLSFFMVWWLGGVIIASFMLKVYWVVSLCGFEAIYPLADLILTFYSDSPVQPFLLGWVVKLRISELGDFASWINDFLHLTSIDVDIILPLLMTISKYILWTIFQMFCLVQKAISIFFLLM